MLIANIFLFLLFLSLFLFFLTKKQSRTYAEKENRRREASLGT